MDNYPEGRTMPAEPRYDAVADFYIGEIGDDLGDPATSALLDLADVRPGMRVLDVACGQGRVSRELARRGAAVLGLDVSARLIEAARVAERAAPLGIEYVVADAAGTPPLRRRSFAVAVCNFGLADIDDLPGLLRTVRGALAPRGSFVFSILHPCFPGRRDRAAASWPPGRGYFHEGWWRTDTPGSEIRRRVGANHRTLSTYLNALADAGLAIERVLEPPPPGRWADTDPTWDPAPTFLVVRAAPKH